MESKGKKKKVRKRGIPVSSAAKKRIKELRLSEDISVEALADRTGVSERTIRNLENTKHSQKHYDEEKLRSIANAMGVALNYILKEQYTDLKENGADFSFEFLIEQFREISQNLLVAIRDHKHAPMNVVEQHYRDCISMRLVERNISLEYLDRAFRNPIHRRSLLESVPKTSLSIEVSEDLSKILYRCNSGEELVVKDPELMWDCHCDTPDIKQRHFKCRIHSKPAADEVDARFKAGYVLIKYGELQFYWRNSSDLWPPSIDSFHMLEAMKQDGLFSEPYSSVIDVGSGTGFLGIVTAMRNQHINAVILSDWLPVPYLYGTVNWYLNRKGKEHVNFKANIGLFTSGLDPAVMPCDVAICNPPYLPLLDGHEDIGMESTVAGTDLLTNVIMESKSIARKIYIQFSNLAMDEANDAADRVGVKLKRVGKERHVPFRLRILWDRPEYLEKLVKKKGLIDNAGLRHRFWHRIQTYVIE